MHRRMKPGGGAANWQEGREGWITLPNGLHVRKDSKRHRDAVAALERAQREHPDAFDVSGGDV